ncbi:putative colanic acid biosynthesis acetyltransferase [Paraburkholderia sp. Tr-20389]|uniref:DapH/DapD/GlmU-related protein n=1 Tax=Paraburkholderia sp. Tr-20389 TaxID=2703903 RepID=UPI0019804F7A|nr:DapH/DapD/GlmU-related protein [Paraburkholderia sp. Tr-20389]MBN3757018.1 putative colanic acid biosynthesis acetyltransferase [Paraburkholderia sp. Tr-20389]
MDNTFGPTLGRAADGQDARMKDQHAARASEAAAPPDSPLHDASVATQPPGRVIDLSLAGKGNYVSSRGFLTELIWFFIEACVINNKLLPVSSVRVALLRLFGAKIGANCRFVHPVRVKAPWNLTVGDNCWFGVDVWIYNQAPIRIGSNVCISQGSFLSAGSHDMRTNMDLCVAPIVIEDGAWISSKCVVQMGVTIGRSAVVTPLSVVHRSLEAEGVYGGNPCRFIRKRFDADVGRAS